jgi:transcriptional regulator with XRE-family HTH domain
MSRFMFELARRINQCIESYNESHARRVSITPAMSRILENDPDYVPYRPRRNSRSRGPASRPSLITIMEIAEVLGTTVSYLIGERPDTLTSQDLRNLAAIAGYLQERFPEVSREPRSRSLPRE